MYIYVCINIYVYAYLFLYLSFYLSIYLYIYIYIYIIYITIILYIGSVYMVPLKKFESFLKTEKSNIGGGVRPYIEGEWQ